MAEPPRIKRYDLRSYLVAYVHLDATEDDLLLGAVEGYAYASGEDCWLVNVDLVLGALQEQQLNPTPGELALLLLCRQAEDEQYDDVLIYSN